MSFINSKFDQNLQSGRMSDFWEPKMLTVTVKRQFLHTNYSSFPQNHKMPFRDFRMQNFRRSMPQTSLQSLFSPQPNTSSAGYYKIHPLSASAFPSARKMALDMGRKYFPWENACTEMSCTLSFTEDLCQTKGSCSQKEGYQRGRA